MTTNPQMERDVEKASGNAVEPLPVVFNGPEESQMPDDSARQSLEGLLKRFQQKFIAENVETRGIQRVTEPERIKIHWKAYAQMFLMWFSVNLTANNITLGMLGPAVYYLSFKDSSLCSVFGAILGSLPIAYMATWGPRSGNRTMIFARYTMGWWPSRLLAALNIIIGLGYSMIDCVVAGQILSAVSAHGSMSIVVGIIITAVIAWVICTFGISLYHHYQRWAYIPQLIAIFVAYGVTSKYYDHSISTQGNTATRIGDRISFFSLCLSAAITYAGSASDYFVYYPTTTGAVPIFILTFLALIISFTITFLLGIGLASAMNNVSSYASAYDVSQGALLVKSLTEPLGSFGSFLSVLVALGLINNLIVPTYSCGIDFQILSSKAKRIHRVYWTFFGVIVYTVCALAGRNQLANIFMNFLALMGYWVSMWIAITLEDHLLFRRPSILNSRKPLLGQYIWEDWDTKSKLPIGIAALISFLIGYAGAVLCMAQVWYIGPIAKLVGDYGADLGNYVGFVWTALVYPPLRWAEIRYYGR